MLSGTIRALTGHHFRDEHSGSRLRRALATLCDAQPHALHALGVRLLFPRFPDLSLTATVKRVRMDVAADSSSKARAYDGSHGLFARMVIPAHAYAYSSASVVENVMGSSVLIVQVSVSPSF